MESFTQTLLANEEDVQVRVAAIKNLSSLASQLGPERVLSELLPALNDAGILDDEDELLEVLAEELGDFLPLVGDGIPAVIDILESLCKCEETTVCQKAADGLCKISIGLPDETFESLFVDLVIRLAEEEWFGPKAASCSLFPAALKRASPEKKTELVEVYVSLCKGKTPMVRRAAASHLKHIFPLLSFDVIIENFMEVYHLLSKDDQDSVRLLVVEVAASLSACFSAAGQGEKNEELVQPVLITCAKDKSWRVRYMVASCFVSIAEGLGSDLTRKLTSVFVDLLKDSEAEVRTAAAGKVSGVSTLLSTEEVVSSLLPQISQLVSDDSQQVRIALAGDVMMLAPIFGKEGTSEHLLGLFLQLLKDDAPEVRLSIISKLDQVTQVIGLDKLSEHLIPAIVELAEDKQWRIRLSVIKYIPPLAKQLSLEFFIAKLGDLCYGWMSDTVYAIRQAAIENLKDLILIFGQDFHNDYVLPKIQELKSRTNYLHRMTVLRFIKDVAPVLDDDSLKNNLLSLTLSLAKDPVPNIRFSVACVLEVAFIDRLDKDIIEKKIAPVLKELQEDEDCDVQSYAASALCKI